MLLALTEQQRSLFGNILDGSSHEAKNPEVNQRITVASINYASQLNVEHSLDTNERLLGWFADELRESSVELRKNHNSAFFGEENLIRGLDQINTLTEQFISAYSDKNKLGMQLLFPSLYTISAVVLSNLYPLSHKIDLLKWVQISKAFRGEISNDRNILNEMKVTKFDASSSLFSTGEVFPSFDWAKPIFTKRTQASLGSHVTLKDLTHHLEKVLPDLKNVWVTYVNVLPARSFSWVNVEQWQFPSADDLINAGSVIMGTVLSEIYRAAYAEMVCLRTMNNAFDGNLNNNEIVNLVFCRTYRNLVTYRPKI